MRADELMIGDWVLDTFGNPIQVKELLEDGINGEWDDAECDGVEAVYDDIKPIPIDEDILEKNGWVGAGENMFVKQPYRITKAYEVWGVAYGMAYVAEIRYVHELQNIMRITGYQGGIKVRQTGYRNK